MKFAIKWTPGFLALMLVLAADGQAVTSADSTQIITLSDGHQYRFAGASGGTNHVLPGSLYPITTREGLFIWLEPTGSNAKIPFHTTPFQAGGTLDIQGTLVDEKGLAGSTPTVADFVNDRGASIYNNLPGPPGCVFLRFPVVPRRRPMLECRLDEFSGPGPNPAGVRPDSMRLMGRLKFRNPLFGDYPQWQAEALPAVKPIGEDIDVRLNRFDKPRSPSRFGDPTYRFSLSFLSSRAKNETWELAKVEVTDATGNRIDSDVFYPPGHDGYGIYDALWPDEAAVRLTLTLKRTSGFLPSELVTFTNLPVLHLNGDSYAPANGTSLTNRLDGIPIAVRNIFTEAWHWSHGPPAVGSYVVELDIPTQPPGVIADIVEVATETGNVLTAPDSVGPQPRTYVMYYNNPPPAKFLNVTVAAQKSRTVEFLVNPK